MVLRFAGQLARLGDAHEAQVHSGDAFEWCDAAYLKRSSTSSASASLDRQQTRLQQDFAALVTMPTSK